MRLPHRASETVVFLHYVTITCPLEPLCFCTTMVEGALFINRTYWVNLCIQKYISLQVGQPRLKSWHSGTQTASVSANVNNFWKSFTIPNFFVPIFDLTFPICPIWVTYNDIVLISAIFHKISKETNISFKTRKFQTLSYFRHNKQESYMMQI